jgi:hypothetical protein
MRESTQRHKWQPHARLSQFGRRRSHGSAEDARLSGTPSAKPTHAVNLSPTAPAVGGLVTPGASVMLEPTRVVVRLGRRPPRLEPVIGVDGRGIMCRTAMQAPTGMGMTWIEVKLNVSCSLSFCAENGFSPWDRSIINGSLRARSSRCRWTTHRSIRGTPTNPLYMSRLPTSGACQKGRETIRTLCAQSRHDQSMYIL